MWKTALVILVSAGACDQLSSESGPASRPTTAGAAREVGVAAPTIDLQQVLQAPKGADASLKALRGKVVVLEFWATWCPNCVKAIPHFNALADSLKAEPVQFISVTDEDAKTVAPFLKRHPIRGWVGLNTTGSMIRSYGIHTGKEQTDAERPLTVVIRPDGTVDARLRPYANPFPITARNLMDLAHGKPSGLVSSRIIFAGCVKDTGGKPLADATVRAKEVAGPDTSIQIGGEVVTDRNGQFTIDCEEPLSRFSGHPIVLEVVHAGYSDGGVSDLRPLSAAEQRSLRVTLRRPGAGNRSP